MPPHSSSGGVFGTFLFPLYVGDGNQFGITYVPIIQRRHCVRHVMPPCFTLPVMEQPPSAAHFLFCSSSSETFGDAMRSFIAQLAVPWTTAPILSFHIRNPVVLVPYQALLQHIRPPGPLSLQFDDFRDFGALGTILSSWPQVQSLRITVGSADRLPYTRATFHRLYLAPFEDGLSFPTMCGVKAVIVQIVGAEIALVSVCFVEYGNELTAL